MNKKKYIFTQNDIDAWEHEIKSIIKTSHDNEIYPTSNKQKLPLQKTLPTFPPSKPEIKPSQNITHDLSLDSHNKINHNTLKKIKKNIYPIDVSIDLHGYGFDDAYIKIMNTLSLAITNKHRLILVITGKGTRSKSKTTLKNSFIKFLNSSIFKANILYITHAHNIHGGEGAFYLFLKK